MTMQRYRESLRLLEKSPLSPDVHRRHQIPRSRLRENRNFPMSSEVEPTPPIPLRGITGLLHAPQDSCASESGEKSWKLARIIVKKISILRTICLQWPA